MEFSTKVILFVFIISLILSAIAAAISKVKYPIQIGFCRLFLKRREKRVGQRVRLNTAFRLAVYVFALGLFWCSETLAQSCANYAPVTRATGVIYNSIAGSSPSYFTWRNTTLNQNDDNRSYPIPIGFDFWYLGIRYTQLTGSLNGTLDFSTSTSDGNNGGIGPYGPNYNNLFSTANQTMLALAPLYADLWTTNGGTTPIAVSLAYQVSGSAPNRVLTVEWINFDEWNTPVNVPAASVNMQVKIYETTGVIEFIYGTMTAGASGGGSYPLRYTCGINNTWSAGAPNATQLLTQQVANATTFNNTPQNVLTTLPASNSKLTFTPPAPTAAPTGLTFTAITRSGMTLNWTDNAINEVGYVVYYSTDNVNFDFVSQVAADSTSATVTNLSSGTTYYWRVAAVTDGALSSPLTATQATLPAGTITSVANGNWNAAGTWDCGCIPTAGDNVIIANGTTVTLDVNSSCNSLVVGQGVSGQFIIGNDATARILAVSNDVTVNSGGTLITGGAAATHTMNLGGDLINNGTLNLAPTGTRVCNVIFNKNGNQTISGNGVTTNFSRITLNMGTSNFNVLDVASSNFTVTNNFLTLTNGTFKLSTGAAVIPFAGNATISASSGIWLDNAAASITTTGGTTTLYGLLRATAGTMNIGSATNNNLISYGGTITVDGGAVNVAGRFDRAGPTILTYFTISAGTLTVASVGSTIAGAAPFRIDEVGSTFNMSGGTIIIRRPGAGNLGYLNTGGTFGMVSGGTLQIGDASTPPEDTIQINSSVAVPNLEIGNGVSVTAQLVTNSLIVKSNISINSGTLDANGLNITLGGTWTNNGGTFTPGTGTVMLNGSAAQNIGGSSTTSFDNIVMNNAAGLIINRSPIVNGILTLTNGIITTDSNNVYIGSGGAVSRTSGHVAGNLRKFIATGATSKNFEIGGTSNYTPVAISFGNVSTGGILTASTTGTDHPDIANSGINASKSVNRFWSLNNSGIVFTNCSATFNFVTGDIDAGAVAANFVVKNYGAPNWTSTTVGARTVTSTQAVGLMSLSDFAVGEQKTFTITPTKEGIGAISPSAPVSVDYGGNQEFMITPSIGNHVDSVFVDDSYVDSTTSYTFYNVTEDHTIHAKFVIDKFTITPTVEGKGSGTISPSVPVRVDHGGSQGFTIATSLGHHVDSLFVDGIHVDSTTSYTFYNVTENHTIHVKFALDEFTVTPTTEGSGAISPSIPVSVNFGGSQGFAVTPSLGYHVDSLFVDGIHVDSTTSYTFYNVTENHTIHAKFRIDRFTITSSAGLHGSISPTPSATVDYGGSLTFTVTPSADYHIDSLFVDGTHVDSTVSFTFTNIIGSHTIHATFAINVYTITASAGANGIISPLGAVGVNHGSDQAFAITPVAGYHVDSLIVDGANVDSTTSFTFMNVTGPHTINATFAINVYAIVSSKIGNGTITPSGRVNVNFGADQNFAITPDIHYHIDTLFVDGSHVDSMTSYTFNKVTENHTILAKFVIDVYKITASAETGGTINPSGDVIVDYGASQNFIFTPSLGYHYDSLFVDGLHTDSTSSYTFNDVTANHTINAKFEINRYTITSSAGTHGAISPLGNVSVDYGSNKKYTITPDEGYHVDSLLVDGLKVDSTTSYTFINITSNRTIEAEFAIDVYTISATASSGGMINPAGDVKVNHGESKPFEFAPELNYHFDSLFVDGVHADSTTSYTFVNVTANHAIHVKFSVNTYTITASAGTNGSISPSGAVSANHGSNKVFTIIPNIGYHVDSLFVDGTHEDSITSYTFYNVTESHTIRAVFAINVYTITSSAESGGTINPSGEVITYYGENKQYTFTPDAGFHKDSLMVDGALVDSTASYTFKNIAANHTIRVTFRINDYTITATAGAGGVINPSGAVHVPYGENQDFTFGPNEGYGFDSLFVDGIHSDSSASYTFHNVTANHTIHAEFVINKFTITSTAGNGGTINPLGTVSVDYGTNKTFTITPNTGYNVDTVTVDGGKVDSTMTYSFNNVRENHTISVIFILKKVTIIATAGTGGIISPSGSLHVDYGTSQKFTMAPGIGYNIDSIFVDGTFVDSTASYTFNNVVTNHTIHAKFRIQKFTITATAATNGTITPSGLVNVSYGDSVSFTMRPNPGYIVDSVFVDGGYANNDTVYVFENISMNHTIHVTFTFTEDVADRTLRIPKEYALYPNYPNPFNPTTRIEFDIPSQSVVTLKVYNLLGNEIAEVLKGQMMEAGVKQIRLDGSNLASGIYFYRLVAEGTNGKTFTAIKRMVLVK